MVSSQAFVKLSSQVHADDFIKTGYLKCVMLAHSGTTFSMFSPGEGDGGICMVCKFI